MAEGSILERLDQHLRDELILHRELLAVAERKRDVIVCGDIASFGKILGEERALVDRGAQLRRVREALLTICAQHFSCPHEQLRMAHILERTPEPLRSQLGGVRLELKSVLEQLRELNERNVLLIRQSLDFVQEVLSIVAGNSGRRLDYDASGQRQSQTAAGGGIVSFKA